MSKHTGGPWIAHPFRQGEERRFRVIQLGWSGGARGLAVVQRTARVNDEAVAANATLIAAAPDLLDALRSAEEYIAMHSQADGMGNRDYDHDIYERHPLLIKLRNTIANATGEQP